MSFKATIAALAAACALGGASAQAAVIYSNFAPGYGFDPVFAVAVASAGSFAGEEVSSGMVFTAGIEGDVSEINIALSSYAGDGAADVSLWTFDLTTQLGAWHLTDIPDIEVPAASKISGITGVHLNAGVSYVLVAKTFGVNFQGWHHNTTGAVGEWEVNNRAFSDLNSPLGAFDILSASASAPEPAAWAMMIIGFGGVGGLMRRRRLAGA